MTAMTKTLPSPTASARGGKLSPPATPRLLRGALVVLLLATALWWCGAESALGDAKRGVTVVGRDSVPSIIAAQEIRSSLARANAHAIRATLAPQGQDALAEWCDYEVALETASDRLVTAAQNMTHSGERAPI